MAHVTCAFFVSLFPFSFAFFCRFFNRSLSSVAKPKGRVKTVSFFGRNIRHIRHYVIMIMILFHTIFDLLLHLSPTFLHKQTKKKQKRARFKKLNKIFVWEIFL